MGATGQPGYVGESVVQPGEKQAKRSDRRPAVAPLGDCARRLGALALGRRAGASRFSAMGAWYGWDVRQATEEGA